MEPRIIIALILYIIPLILWIWLLKSLPITILQPAMSLTYIITALFAYLFLGETPSIYRCIGLALVIIGVIIISKGDA
jgi:drug/metabolite transporter (DMT)-like permease